MRKRWLYGILAVLVTMVTLKVVVGAQRVPSENLPKPVMTSSPEAQSKSWRAAATSPAQAPMPLPPADLAPTPIPEPSLPPTAGQTVEPQDNNDPLIAVDLFLQTSQKKSEDAIKALTLEAETLRARLQKVENALERWQGVSEALTQQSNAPTTKPAIIEPEEPRPEMIISTPGGILPSSGGAHVEVPPGPASTDPGPRPSSSSSSPSPAPPPADPNLPVPVPSPDPTPPPTIPDTAPPAPSVPSPLPVPVPVPDPIPTPDPPPILPTIPDTAPPAPSVPESPRIP